MSIGKRIKEQRDRLQQSQEEVAKAIGTTKQNIYKYETGIITNIPLDKIEALSNHFGVSPAYLTGWSDTSSRYVISRSSDDHVPDFLTNFWFSLDAAEKDRFANCISNGSAFMASLDSTACTDLASAGDLPPEDSEFLSMFRQLDKQDQQRILGRIEVLLESDKYSTQDGLKNA